MFRNFMAALTHWLKGGTPDARFAPRIAEPSIFVYYWDGSVPEARRIRDISPTGAYILTDEHWYPGTIVRPIFRGYKTPASGHGCRAVPVDLPFLTGCTPGARRRGR